MSKPMQPEISSSCACLQAFEAIKFIAICGLNGLQLFADFTGHGCPGPGFKFYIQYVGVLSAIGCLESCLVSLLRGLKDVCL